MLMQVKNTNSPVCHDMLVGDDGGDGAALRFVSQEIEEESSTCAAASVVRQNRLDPYGAVHQLFR